jgi:hypothetical protein
VVFEQQVVRTAMTGDEADWSGQFKLKIGADGELSGGIDAAATADQLAAELYGLAYAGNTKTLGEVHVTRSPTAGLGYAWTITFSSDVGDIPDVQYDVHTLNDGSNGQAVELEEYVKGVQNHFTIEPKKASGGVVKDVNAAPDFEGRDIFFTELWTSDPTVVDGTHVHSSDGGVATYNRVQYDVQDVVITVASGIQDAHRFKLSMDTTDTFEGGSTFTTADFIYPNTDSEADVIAKLKNMQDSNDSASVFGGETFDVDVEVLSSSANAKTLRITFTSFFGVLPALDAVEKSVGAGNVAVVKYRDGVTEIQTITTSASEAFVPEEVLIQMQGDLGQAITGGSFTVDIGSSSNGPVTIGYADSPSDVEEALETLSTVTDVEVTGQSLPGAAGWYAWRVKFLDPVGDVPDFVIESSLTGVGAEASATEAVPGVAPIGGTFIVAYGEDWTDNLDFDVSASGMKAALESLSTVGGTVDVEREFLGNGHRWTVTFQSNLGNLPLMVATPHR